MDFEKGPRGPGSGESERERFLATALQTVRSLVLVLDHGGRVVFFNRACEEVSGYASEEIEGRCVWDVLLPPEAVGPVKQVFAELRAGRSNEYENVWIAKDGRHRAIAWTNTVLTDQDGRVQYVVPTGVDITERRRAERRAAETDDRYRLLFERAHDAIYLCELPGEDGQGRILEANEPACTRLGYSRDELLRTRVLDVHPPAAHPECRRAEQALRASGALIFETLERRRDGTTLPVEVSTHLVRLGSREVVLTVSRDLSERKRMEQQLVDATRLDAIGRLAGGVAHDFNNLLVVILSGANAILEGLPEGHPLREEAQEIADAGGRGALLTQQLLSHARRGAEKPAPVDLNALVGRMARLLGRLLGERIAIELRLTPGLGAVLVDPGRMQQVVMNLAVNARDAMPEGGTLTLATAEQDLPGQGPGAPARSFVVLRVEDTGAGFGPEVRAQLFQPFFTTKPDGRGTGLGLATTHQVVTKAGGHIDVESEPGVGSRFSVFLPRAAGPAGATAPAEGPAPSLAGLKVLLVEDEAEVLRATARMLRLAGCEVQEVGDPFEALELARRHPERVDLLVTDMVMPGLGGADLARGLRLLRPELPVVYVSGYAADLPGSGSGLDDVLLVTKPFDAPTLLAAVARAGARR